MKLKSHISVALTVTFLSINLISSSGQYLPSGMKIWFNKPAANWNEALLTSDV